MGDLILPESMTERELFKAYPELAPPPGEEESVISAVLQGLILGPPEKYNVVHKISDLTVESNGRGKIELTPILMLDDNTFLELETKLIRNHSDFSSWFATARSLGPLIRLMEGYFYVLYEAMMALGTGGASTVGRGAGRKTILVTLRAARRGMATRVLARKIVTSLSKDTSKATLAGTKSFATTFAKTYLKNTKQQNIVAQQQSAASKKIDRHAYDVALKEAAGAFVASFVSALLGDAVDKMIKNSGYSEINKAISKRIIDSLGTNIPEVFIKGLAEAWVSETQNPGTFAESFGKSLLTGLTSTFTSLVSVDFKKIGEELAKT